MKIRTFLAAAIALLGVDFATASELTTIRDASLKFYDGGTQICSSQVIKVGDDLRLLTAGHCANSKSNKTYNVKVPVYDANRLPVSEETFYVDVIRTDKSKDYSVLKFRDKEVDFPFVDVATPDEASKALVFGKEVVVVGYPGGMVTSDISISEGRYAEHILGLAPDAKKELFVRTAAPISYGSSGGGLYTEIDGTWKLVGVTSQLDPELRYMISLFVSPESIASALKGLTPDAKEPEEKKDEVNIGEIVESLNDILRNK